VEAAAYFSISPSLFDQMVADGRMPKPKRLNSRNVWDRLALDAAFTAIPDETPRDDVWGMVAV
jgi:predicted DNA-binding transcriptional regulator AlpA